jgi:hypothetical protein
LQSSLSAARKIIDEAGLIIGTVQPADAKDENIVVDQSPSAGRDVEQGSAVDLVVRDVSQKVVVPNVLERQLPEAKEIIARSRLKLGKIDPADAPPTSFVVKQSPFVGVQVEQGTSVDLEVKPQAVDPVPRIIHRMADQPDFEKVGASESKLLRIIEKEGIKSEPDFLKMAEDEDSIIRDRFKLRNLESARTFKAILLRLSY